jgi:hypothetical protein
MGKTYTGVGYLTGRHFSFNSSPGYETPESENRKDIHEQYYWYPRPRGAGLPR